jgi:hypothetical protein
MHKVLPCILVWAVLAVAVAGSASDGVRIALVAVPMLFFLVLSVRSPKRETRRDRLPGGPHGAG